MEGAHGGRVDVRQHGEDRPRYRAGLERSAEVEVVKVSEAPPKLEVDVDLIVAGGPTHAFGMSRPTTRGDAIDRGATEGEQGFGLREWIDALPEGPHADSTPLFVRCATFPISELNQPVLVHQAEHPALLVVGTREHVGLERILAR